MQEVETIKEIQGKRGILTRFVVTGFFIVAATYVFVFIFSPEVHSLRDFLIFHIHNPFLFPVLFIPFVLYLVALRFARESDSSTKIITKRISELEAIIERNADFAKSIGEGDFSARVEELDENDKLGKSLLVMRDNLLATSQKEREQNWISKGKDIVSDVLRQHNDINDLAYEVIINILQYTDIIQGAFYIYDEEDQLIKNLSTYAYGRRKYVNQEFRVGYGLIGQAAYEMDFVYRKELPEYYATLTSGLIRDKKPGSIFIMPLISDEQLHGIIEVASIEDSIPELTRRFIKEISVIIAQTVFNLKVNVRTERLLSESQELTKELKENEEQLRENAEEMRVTHEELEKSNEKLEEKITEVQNGQKRLHSLLENASEVISIYNKDKIITYESPSVKSILGYNAEEVIGMKGFTTLDPESKRKYDEVFDILLKNPMESQRVEISYKKPDGSEIWLESLGRNLIDNPAIGGVIFNTRDITQRKIAEKEQRMRGQMQALSENSPDMILRIGLSGKVFYANPMVEKYIGLTTAELIQKQISEVDIAESVKVMFKEIIERVFATGLKFDEEFDFITPDSNAVMLINAIPEQNEFGEIETVLVVLHDITERKQIELEIQDKNKKIEDSINYAKRIQESILPDTNYIREYLPDSFIFYVPRDVVSGDFPWFFEKNGFLYIAAVDCTGHGVPGALLSFIGYFNLNNIVDHDRELSAGQILDLLHSNVRTTLKQDREGAHARDGMDIALVKIHPSRNKIEFSGAHRPLYLLRNGVLEQYKGNPKAIGGIPLGKKVEKDFVNYTIDIQKGDKIFFFSDGLPDQIGGTDKRKYQAKRIREALENNADYHISKFNGYFANDFKEWMGQNKQIDDVLLIGIEF